MVCRYKSTERIHRKVISLILMLYPTFRESIIQKRGKKNTEYELKKSAIPIFDHIMCLNYVFLPNALDKPK